MKFWDQYYYRCMKFMSHTLGVWPYQTNKEAFFYRCLAAAGFFGTVTPQLLALRNYIDDMPVVIESLSVFLIDLTFVCDAITYFVNWDRMKAILDKLRENWETFPEQNGRQVLHKYSMQGQTLAVAYSAGCLTTGLVFTSKSLQLKLIYKLFNVNATIPPFYMPLEYPYIDVDKYYYVITVTIAMSIVILIMMIISYDLFFFLCAQHVCGLFAAAGCYLQQTPENDGAYNHLRTFIQIHNRAIEFTKLLDSTFLWNNMVLLGVSAINISIIGLQTARHLDRIGESIQYGLYVFTVLSRFFVICFFAQRVMDHSRSIQTSLTNLQWYNIPIKSHILIQLAILRSQTSSTLGAGKTLVLSLELFVTATKASASYFTVLLAMQ
ncbi:odorant receptor Or2-like isoform X1 [Diachasmimorpha longicaudata]|uniref:odorant receptor Or2-like isoform X1 n=1 Tax=Diachasmimorpha longicaudata TaxID=58733 RepID=UPI0030B8CD09